MSDSLQFNSRVGDDGVLNVQINLGHTEAKKEVVVTIQSTAENMHSENGTKVKDQSWSDFLDRTYGSCHDLGLERHDQGGLERREPMQ